MLYPLTIRDFLDRAEHVYPDRAAIVDEPEQPAPGLGEITYRETAALARAQAARLDQLGVPVGGRVAIVWQNSARLLTSFFGVSGWGRVLVPVNFRLSRPEIEYIVRHCGAAVVYADPALRDVRPARRDRRRGRTLPPLAHPGTRPASRVFPPRPVLRPVARAPAPIRH